MHRRSDLIYSRNIARRVEMWLYVASAGLCQLPSCRQLVLQHPSTHIPINLGEKAHIIAFKVKGKRGKSALRPKDINSIDNLMLLCPSCHKLIDDNETTYTIQRLRQFKREHEADVRQTQKLLQSRVTDTAVIRFTAPIGGRCAEIPDEHVHHAIFPNRLKGEIYDISLENLHSLPEETIYSTGTALIQERLTRFRTTQSHASPYQYLSLFGLGPIPLLIQLGFAVGRDLPVKVYNRQHHTDDWRWIDKVKTSIKFESRLIRQGTCPKSIALLVSSSGQVHAKNLPTEIDARFFVYSIHPRDVVPSKNVMRCEATLAEFKNAYEGFRALIRSQHVDAQRIHLFSAVPPAIAITLGRELIAKVDPELIVYDWRRDHYIQALGVNTHD